MTGSGNDVQPKFTLDDVKFAESDAMFRRALDLFRGSKVRKFSQNPRGYSAVVAGGHSYQVSLSNKRIDYGDCTCYMGQNDELCKHMLALALYVLHACDRIDENGERAGNNQLDPADARLHINAGVRKIKAYTGPSRIWFSYQRELDVGAGMIIEGVAMLEPDLNNAKYLWKLVLRLSKKLSHGGVDDSNGTVGGAIDAVVERIVAMAKQDAKIASYAARYFQDDTGFNFEEDLAKALQDL